MVRNALSTVIILGTHHKAVAQNMLPWEKMIN